MRDNTNMMKIVAAISRRTGDGDTVKTYWNQIGVAFQNRDGSWNLRFDYLPARMAETTIQLREIDAKEEAPGS